MVKKRKTTHFERAIFLSWYCSKGDCAFCYMSTQPKTKIDPKKSRRSFASIFAEAIICKACGWKIEFLSGGCDSFNDEELLFILQNIYKITGQKQWLNIGIVNEEQIKLFKPYTEGVCGTIECISPKLRDKICPSKPIYDIGEMFTIAETYNLNKTITVIIGLGEKIEDFSFLEKLVKKHNLDRITFYRLKPQKNTLFEGKSGPSTEYYVSWIRKTRAIFPEIKIVAGSWLTHLEEIHQLLDAGADAVTKFPSIRLFGSRYAQMIEEQSKKAGKSFLGTLTRLPHIDIEKEVTGLGLDNKLQQEIKEKLNNYLIRMKKHL